MPEHSEPLARSASRLLGLQVHEVLPTAPDSCRHICAADSILLPFAWLSLSALLAGLPPRWGTEA